MDKVADKISVRQFFIIYVIGISSTIIRIVPRYASYFAKQATWVSALLTVVPIIALSYLLFIIMQKGKDESFEISLERIFGKIGGKCITAIYLIMMMLFLTLRIRYFAEKCIASLYTNVELEFFIISILLVTFLMCKHRLEGLARFCEVIWIPLICFILLVLLILTPNIKLSNIYPITTNDIGGILKGTLSIASTFVYLPGLLFLGDNIADKEKFIKSGKRYMILASVIASIVALSTVGVFGDKLSQVLTQPYFMALKDIELFTVIERVEALGITFWIVTDIVLIVSLVYVVTTIIRKLFKLKSRGNMIFPVLILQYVLGLFIASNIFELENYSRGIGSYVYMIVGFVIPAIVFVVGKLRKKI